VTCDATTNGGSAVTPLTISYTVGQAGVTCTTPAARSGYTYNGYFTAPSGGSAVTFPYIPTANTTLYAQWTELAPTVQNVSVVVYFAWDSRELNSKAKSKLNEFIASLPANAKDIKIEVNGYAQFARQKDLAKSLFNDERGDAAYNQQLSLDRANSVLRYLESKGLADVEAVVSAMGWDDDSRKSRRAEVQISYTI